MATVKAFIRTSKNNNEVTIRFRLSDGRSVQIFHVSELVVKPDVWDNKEQCIKKRVLYNEEARQKLNTAVNDRKALILKVYNLEMNKEGLTSEWLDTAVDKALYPEKYKPQLKIDTLFKFTEQFIADAPNRKDKTTGRLLTYNNIQQYKATEKHLKAFAAKIRKKDFRFDEINQLFYDGFTAYLQNEIQAIDENGKPKIDENNKPVLLKEAFTANSVGKHIRILKLMLNEATMQGINTSNYYNSFHVFTEEVDTVYLTETELQQLKDKDFSKSPYLDRVRDWFLLLAWTGCRFSDLEKVGKTDIKDGFITFRQQKTNTKVTIPLHPVVLEILEKYNFNLPEPITNQRFNEYIKEVAKLAGINSVELVTTTIGGKLETSQHPKWKLVSSHTGRRSFCTNMYKRGLPTLMIMSISGHKTEKSFLKYIKVKQSEHAELMAKAWQNIYK
ncbi:site-specific integrase [Dysgonomonas sp. Marseille-P4677]|uniref:site-specific integrase n=1 Tax=Dysgonomonas sp. Marseille-P4677 TaxID=2364790 RepID=UPI0019149129|nr:site-specific integrase [Dysgonomonas sp. Marseille-P4677]MBK5722176.1 site-specific integrase [Dysgonomonas sp. Marseille-P4677]